jgi:hypothetical protein
LSSHGFVTSLFEFFSYPLMFVIVFLHLLCELFPWVSSVRWALAYPHPRRSLLLHQDQRIALLDLSEFEPHSSRLSWILEFVLRDLRWFLCVYFCV